MSHKIIFKWISLEQKQMNYTMTVYFETEEFANAQNAILHFQLNISHQIKIKTLTNCNVCHLKNR